MKASGRPTKRKSCSFTDARGYGEGGARARRRDAAPVWLDRNAEGKSLLHLAARHGLTAVVRELLKLGASLHEVCENGRTPLHDAAEAGNVDGVQELLAVSDETHLALLDSDRYTPLALAAKSGSVSVARALLGVASCGIAKDDNNDGNNNNTAGRSSSSLSSSSSSSSSCSSSSSSSSSSSVVVAACWIRTPSLLDEICMRLGSQRRRDRCFGDARDFDADERRSFSNRFKLFTIAKDAWERDDPSLLREVLVLGPQQEQRFAAYPVPDEAVAVGADFGSLASTGRPDSTHDKGAECCSVASAVATSLARAEHGGNTPGHQSVPGLGFRDGQGARGGVTSGGTPNTCSISQPPPPVGAEYQPVTVDDYLDMRTALAGAAAHEALRVCCFLVREAGADVNRPSLGAESSPLHYATEGGSVAVVALLLAAKASINAVDLDGKSPLHQVSLPPVPQTSSSCLACRPHQALAKFLLVHGADPLLGTKYGRKALSVAAFVDGNFSVELLSGHPRVDCLPVKTLFTLLGPALDSALDGCHPQRVATLMTRLGIRPRVVSLFTEGAQPTEFIPEFLRTGDEDDVPLLQWMLSDAPKFFHRTCLSGVCPDLQSLLHHAVERASSNNAFVRVLLESKASTSCTNIKNDTPLHMAASHGNAAALHQMLVCRPRQLRGFVWALENVLSPYLVPRTTIRSIVQMALYNGSDDALLIRNRTRQTPAELLAQRINERSEFLDCLDILLKAGTNPVGVLEIIMQGDASRLQNQQQQRFVEKLRQRCCSPACNLHSNPCATLSTAVRRALAGGDGPSSKSEARSHVACVEHLVRLKADPFAQRSEMPGSLPLLELAAQGSNWPVLKALLARAQAPMPEVHAKERQRCANKALFTVCCLSGDVNKHRGALLLLEAKANPLAPGTSSAFELFMQQQPQPCKPTRSQHRSDGLDDDDSSSSSSDHDEDGRNDGWYGDFSRSWDSFYYPRSLSARYW